MTNPNQNQGQNQRDPKDAGTPAQNPSSAEKGAKPAQGAEPTPKA